MLSLTANEAKDQFSATLVKAQHEPVQISKDGSPVAVIMSDTDYQILNEMKRFYIQSRFEAAEKDIKTNNVYDGEAIFAELYAKIDASSV